MKCTQIGQEGRLAWKYTYIYMFVLVCSKLLMFDMELIYNKFSLDYLLDLLSCGLERCLSFCGCNSQFVLRFSWAVDNY